MTKKNLFFLFVFFCFSFIIYFSSSAWFIYFPKEYLYSLSGSAGLFQLVLLFISIKKENSEKILSVQLPNSILWIILICLSSFLLFIVFPIRNLSLGDGTLLLEHVALEAKMFGYHLTMDEIFEALIHSVLFVKFPAFFPTPIAVYRFVSTVCGLFAISFLVYFFRKFKHSILGYILVLSAGGMYLFHGYSENYTIITSVLWIYILFSIQMIQKGEKRNLEALLPICFIACILILLHLVSGYLLFSLVYLCYHFSDRGKFITNAVYCTLFSALILAPVFLYFIFFSDVRFDFTQTHLTNPKFYPFSKIISTIHFRDIFFCIIGSAFLPFIILLYSFLFYKNQFIETLKRKDLRFLSFVLFGFFLHGFFHYPQLGFPADWDLLAFFWTPISFLSVFVLEDLNKTNDLIENDNRILSFYLVPIFVFSVIVYISNAVYLSKPDEPKIAELDNALLRIEKFSNSNESKLLKQVLPKYKKFYLKVSFFLFESKEKIIEMKDFDSKKSTELLNQNQIFREELDSNIERVESKWQKEFYSRLTTYHLDYLELLKKK